jgi:hypothetical protein
MCIHTHYSTVLLPQKYLCYKPTHLLCLYIYIYIKQKKKQKKKEKRKKKKIFSLHHQDYMYGGMVPIIASKSASQP